MRSWLDSMLSVGLPIKVIIDGTRAQLLLTPCSVTYSKPYYACGLCPMQTMWAPACFTPFFSRLQLHVKKASLVLTRTPFICTAIVCLQFVNIIFLSCAVRDSSKKHKSSVWRWERLKPETEGMVPIHNHMLYLYHVSAVYYTYCNLTFSLNPHKRRTWYNITPHRNIASKVLRWKS